jgi:hypothetical protein
MELLEHRQTGIERQRLNAMVWRTNTTLNAIRGVDQ